MRRPHRSADVAGDHGCGQAVGTIVSKCQNLAFFIECEHRKDGPEDFLARDFYRILYLVENRRADEVTSLQPLRHLRTIDQFGIALAARDIALHAFLLPRGDQWAHGRCRIHLIAEFDALSVVDHFLKHFVVDLFVQEQPGARGADLALVAENRHCGDLRRLIGGDDRALAAELETDGFERIGSRRGNALAGHRASGEHHLGDHVMRDQCRSSDRTVARHDIHHACRNAGLDDQLTKIHDGQARLLRRLHDDGVTCGDGRRYFPNRLQQGIVPRNDPTDHAKRLA